LIFLDTVPTSYYWVTGGTYGILEENRSIRQRTWRSI